jgi:hypothetical protein
MEGSIQCECGENKFFYFEDYAVCSNCSNEFKITKVKKRVAIPNGSSLANCVEIWMRRVNRETGKCSNWERWPGTLANNRKRRNIQKHEQII